MTDRDILLILTMLADDPIAARRVRTELEAAGFELSLDEAVAYQRGRIGDAPNDCTKCGLPMGDNDPGEQHSFCPTTPQGELT